MNPRELLNADNLTPFEALSPAERLRLTTILSEQFSEDTASALFDIGKAEEKQGLLAAPISAFPGDFYNVEFTESALFDWKFLANAHIVGTHAQYSELLPQGLALLREKDAPGDARIRLHRFEAFLMRAGILRWVYRHEHVQRKIVVHAISRRLHNPLRKVWRYFDQRKAIDLLGSREIYLRRLDLFPDPFEGSPTLSMIEVYKRALERSLPGLTLRDFKTYENARRAIFVCCWHKAEHESAQMWQSYGRDKSTGQSGGLALQTTERQLEHEFVRMNAGREILFFREITYVDHSSYDPRSHGVPEQIFLKSTWFADEKEMRIAWFHPNAISGTQPEIESNLAVLPEFVRIPIDLEKIVGKIVLNPEASGTDNEALARLIDKKILCLKSRIMASALKSKPLVAH